MVSFDILKKIQEIKIRTRRAMHGTIAGSHVTKQKGFGFEFDQIRGYSYGDDIRFIDWNSSARSGKLLVRQYLDEKNRTILLCLDVSASTFFAGKQNQTSDIMQQVAAILTFVSEFGQDAVGLILFSDHIEKFIPPSRGHKHSLMIIEAIFSHKPVSKKTDMNVLCNYLVESYKKQALAIIISDFIYDHAIESSLKVLAYKREVIAIRCLDKLLFDMPSVGYIWGEDPETGQISLLSFNKVYRENIQKKLQSRILEQNQLLQKYNIDYVDLAIDKNFLSELILFFKQRRMVL